jgi:hypothetical protein
MLIEDTRPWPHYCTRCNKELKDIHESNCGHGFEEWCNDCEDSYRKWYKK